MYDNAKLDSMLNLKGYDEKAYFFMLDGDQNITYTNQSGIPLIQIIGGMVLMME